MLNFSFLITSFLSISWFFYCLKNIDPNFSSIAQIYPNVLMILTPILIMWVIFAIIKNYAQNSLNTQRINFFLEQTQKNTKAITSLTEVVSSYSKEIKSNFILQQAELLISDINEILSEIIKRSNSISSLQMEHLLTRASKGERWLIAKSLIETNNFQSDFITHLQEKSLKDPLLKGSILEFYVRYSNLHDLLEKYDTYKILYNSVEYGALGKVFNILTPVIEKLSQKTDNEATEKPTPKQETIKTPIDTQIELPSFLTSSSFNTPKKTAPAPAEPQKIDIDEGLKAIKEELIKDSPKQTVSSSYATKINNFSNTQSALRNLKKEALKSNIISIDELEKEINSSPDNNFDEKTTPFGDWLNEKKI